MMKFIVVAVFLFICSATSAYKSYEGYKFLRTSAIDHEMLVKLKPLLQGEGLELFNSPRVGQGIEIFVSEDQITTLEDTFIQLGLDFEVVIADVGAKVRNEREQIDDIKKRELRDGLSRNVTFERYMTFFEIIAYLDEVVATYPDIAHSINLGHSYEGNLIRGVKISTGPGKPGVFLDAGIHACEWACPPSLIYAIEELTQNFEVNKALLENHDYYIVPIMNPDGYMYSWSGQRFWRKTRQPNEGSACIGTDPNRNWDFHWTPDNDICSVNYAGSGPFSSVETRNLALFLIFNTQITSVISVHSFGQQILYPWGYTHDLPPNDEELKRIGDEASNALATVRGTKYSVGTIANTLYVAVGGTTDWVYGGAYIQIAYTLELSAGGSLGFDLPPEEIQPVVTETWEAIKVIASYTPPVRG